MLEEEPLRQWRRGRTVTGDCFVGMRKGLRDLKQHGFISWKMEYKSSRDGSICTEALGKFKADNSYRVRNYLGSSEDLTWVFLMESIAGSSLRIIKVVLCCLEQCRISDPGCTRLAISLEIPEQNRENLFHSNNCPAFLFFFYQTRALDLPVTEHQLGSSTTFCVATPSLDVSELKASVLELILVW